MNAMNAPLYESNSLDVNVVPLYDNGDNTIHECLSGGVGRAVSYRPPRYAIKEVAPYSDAAVLIGSAVFRVLDVSLSGVSALAPIDNSSGLELGSRIQISVVVGDHSLYSGEAEVVRAEDHVGRIRFSFRLVEGYLDAVHIQRLDADSQLQRELRGDLQRSHLLIPAQYREAIARLAHFFQRHRQSVDQYLEKYRTLGLPLPEIAEEVYQSVRDHWYELRNHAAETAIRYIGSPEAYTACKRFTEELVTKQALDGPLIYRSLVKPLGYSGDYMAMIYLYRNQFEGSTIPGKVFHKLMCDEQLGDGIRARKQYLVETIASEYRRFCSQATPETTFQVTSLGSGSAMEVADFLETHRHLDVPIHWSLIDQEEEALTYSYHEIFRIIKSRRLPVEITCLHLSFAQLMKGPLFGLHRRKQHIIYSAGLFDYLRPRTARALVRTLADDLATGGLLLVGNAAAESPLNPWTIEYMADWNLLYRNREEVFAFAEGITGHTTTLSTEPANAFHFLSIRNGAATTAP
jgi:extracellular factor (EF) 3-hydroxypalmitic acid methyl ester biosynthesis protein